MNGRQIFGSAVTLLNGKIWARSCRNGDWLNERQNRSLPRQKRPDRIVPVSGSHLGIIPKQFKGKAILDEVGEPVIEGLYSLHDFRHAAASLWIEQRVAPKRVQTWMGHASIALTFDVYGHLFAALEEDTAVMAALEAGVMNAEGGSAA